MTNRIITFHLLFAAQFAVIVSGMFVNTKTGLASMAVILMFTTICLIQLANDKQTNWKPGQNIMTYMCIVWLVYYLFEVLNPNNVMEAWNIGITPYALIPLICAFIVPIVIRTKKDIEFLLIVWSIFVLIFTIKGYWQKNHGFSDKDLYFLYTLGGWRTHLIWSGIRYFSCFSDAANYGVHAALSAVVFAISSFYAGSKWKRVYFFLIAICALYGVGISGTRTAMGVIMGGLLMVTIIAKNWKALLAGVFVSIAVFCFFYYTNAGNGNQYIRKMLVGTVAQLGIYVAVNNGFEEINLYGVDHNMTSSLCVNDKNQLCNRMTHFYEESVELKIMMNEDYEQLKIADYLIEIGNLFRSHDLLADYAKSMDVKIINCTPGSMIDSYERIKMCVSRMIL